MILTADDLDLSRYLLPAVVDITPFPGIAPPPDNGTPPPIVTRPITPAAEPLLPDEPGWPEIEPSPGGAAGPPPTGPEDDDADAGATPSPWAPRPGPATGPGVGTGTDSGETT